MAFNCKRIFVSGFNIEEAIYNSYFNSIYSLLLSHLPQNWLKDNLNDNLCQVDPKQIVSKVKQDPENVGICLASAGMVQSALLNQERGIRAAVVHSQYIAKMCRQHNDANICIIPTDCIGEKLCADLVLHYLRSKFDGETKNKHRLGLLEEFQTKYIKEK